jgi:carbonic anhydrase
MASHNIEASRKRLISGVLRFQEEVYPSRKATYEQLAREGQKPHALFITCADSRIDPELITQSGPGEIFVSRNVGNIVPAYGEVLGGVSAVVEYAVTALDVSNVVVCGHTDCGAMVGLLHQDKLTPLPTVQSWLRNGEAALQIVRRLNPNAAEDTLLNNLIEENVLLQLQHLRTHPSVAARLRDGSLGLSAWVYDIAHGIVRIYDEEERKFFAVSADDRTSVIGNQP